MPLLGCAPVAQRCVNTQFWPNATQELTLTSNQFVPVYVISILVFLIFAFLLVFMSCRGGRYFSFVRRSSV
jgi:hypothetical protein